MAGFVEKGGGAQTVSIHLSENPGRETGTKPNLEPLKKQRAAESRQCLSKDFFRDWNLQVLDGDCCGSR